MCNPGMIMMGVGAAASAKGAYDKAQADKQSLLYQSQVDANNAKIAEWQAQDAEYRGQMDEQSARMQTAAVKGSQRAAMAANGVDLHEGSAVDVLTSTDYMGERDAMTIEDNARRAAWGYRTQGVNYQDRSQVASVGASQISPTRAAGTSLLTSAGKVASSWSSMGGSMGGGG